MADNVVLNVGAGGATLATDDIGGVQYQRVKVSFGTDGSAADVSLAAGLPVVEALQSPQVSYVTIVGLAAGNTTNLDSTQITSGTAGKLLSIVFGSSVPLKGLLQTVLNGVGTTRVALFSKAGEEHTIRFPSKEFVTQVYSATVGLDGFRLQVTNLDTSQAADVYCTFFYDETT